MGLCHWVLFSPENSISYSFKSHSFSYTKRASSIPWYFTVIVLKKSTAEKVPPGSQFPSWTRLPFSAFLLPEDLMRTTCHLTSPPRGPDLPHASWPLLTSRGKGWGSCSPHSLLCYSGQTASGDFLVETSSQVQQDHRGNAVFPLSTSPTIVK